MENRELDRFFDAAKGQKELLRPDDAEKIINQGTNTSLFGDLLRRNKMSLIVTSVATLMVAVSVFFSGFGDDDLLKSSGKQAINNVASITKNNSQNDAYEDEYITGYNSNNTQSVDLFVESNDDLVINDAEEVETNQEAGNEVKSENIIANKNGESPNNKARKKSSKKRTRLSTGGVNPIELSKDDLKSLGIILSDDKSLVFNSELGKEVKMKMKLTPNNYNWTISDDNELVSISPTFVTDAKGNKRISLFSDGNGFGMFESFSDGGTKNEMEILLNNAKSNFAKTPATKVTSKNGDVEIDSKYLNYLLYDAFTKNDNTKEDLEKLISNQNSSQTISEETTNKLKENFEPTLGKIIEMLIKHKDNMSNTKAEMILANALEESLKDSISREQLLASDAFGEKIKDMLESRSNKVQFREDVRIINDPNSQSIQDNNLSSSSFNSAVNKEINLFIEEVVHNGYSEEMGKYLSEFFVSHGHRIINKEELAELLPILENHYNTKRNDVKDLQQIVDKNIKDYHVRTKEYFESEKFKNLMALRDAGETNVTKKQKVQFRQNVRIISDSGNQRIQKNMVYNFNMDSLNISEFNGADIKIINKELGLDSLSKKSLVAKLMSGKASDEEIADLVSKALSQDGAGKLKSISIDEEKVMFDDDKQTHYIKSNSDNMDMEVLYSYEEKDSKSDKRPHINSQREIMIINKINNNPNISDDIKAEKIIEMLNSTLDDGDKSNYSLQNINGDLMIRHTKVVGDTKTSRLIDLNEHHTKPTKKNTLDLNSTVEDFVDINTLIPVSVKFDGVNTDYLLWFKPTDEFITKLPSKYRDLLQPEIEATQGENLTYCGEAPKEEEAVMDVWRGCSGAVKNLKVYPNPAVSNITVKFELEELRSYKLTINDMNGNLVKQYQTEDLVNSFSGKNPSDSTVRITGPQEINLDVSDLESGMYYVVVESAQGETAMQRLIVNK